MVIVVVVVSCRVDSVVVDGVNGVDVVDGVVGIDGGRGVGVEVLVDATGNVFASMMTAVEFAVPTPFGEFSL